MKESIFKEPGILGFTTIHSLETQRLQIAYQHFTLQEWEKLALVVRFYFIHHNLHNNMTLEERNELLKKFPSVAL